MDKSIIKCYNKNTVGTTGIYACGDRGYEINETRIPHPFKGRVVHPTHEEIMQYLDCCHYSKWHKGQCTCKTKQQFRECYEQTKKFLTRTVSDDEEIKQGQEANARAMAEIDNELAWLD